MGEVSHGENDHCSVDSKVGGLAAISSKIAGSSSGSRTPPLVTSAICRISSGLARGLASSKS